MKKLYGKTVIDYSDGEAADYIENTEIEYYQIRDDISSKPYGIEVVKKKIENGIINIENKIVHNICYKENETNRLLEILISNKVTPISVDDVMDDLTKIKVI